VLLQLGLEERELGPAGDARGAPEVEDDGAAGEVGKAERLAVEGRCDDRRGRASALDPGRDGPVRPVEDDERRDRQEGQGRGEGEELR
jgi:hypothetical protein